MPLPSILRKRTVARIVSCLSPKYAFGVSPAWKRVTPAPLSDTEKAAIEAQKMQIHFDTHRTKFAATLDKIRDGAFFASSRGGKAPVFVDYRVPIDVVTAICGSTMYRKYRIKQFSITRKFVEYMILEFPNGQYPTYFTQDLPNCIANAAVYELLCYDPTDRRGKRTMTIYAIESSSPAVLWKNDMYYRITGLSKYFEQVFII